MDQQPQTPTVETTAKTSTNVLPQSFLAALLPSNNTHMLGKIGVGVFIPALTLLANPDFVTSALSVISVHMPEASVKLITALVAAYAAYMLLQAKSPSSIHPDAPSQ